jgi:oligopeptide/dipeptide ABC transporter ATP-binding protein
VTQAETAEAAPEAVPAPTGEVILEVKDLKTYFKTQEGLSKAVDGVSYSLEKGKTIGIVGESGCGKSVSSMSILRLIPEPPGEIAGGEILFHGKDLLKLSEKEMRSVRGNQISMIFQEPMTSLNPVFTVGDQIGEVFRIHRGLNKREATQEAIRMLEQVNIPSPAQRVHEYPHQLSGGMRQRVMIAMALACDPELLIADEPTTALDVTVQAQILNLMEELQEKYNSSIIMITHDLGVIAEISDMVAVMYAGQIVEYTDVHTLFENPLHPYTRGLLKSIPKLDEIKQNKKLQAVLGSVPESNNYPVGCRFANRCPMATDECRAEPPAYREVEPNHLVRCIYAEKVPAEIPL